MYTPSNSSSPASSYSKLSTSLSSSFSNATSKTPSVSNAPSISSRSSSHHSNSNNVTVLNQSVNMRNRSRSTSSSNSSNSTLSSGSATQIPSSSIFTPSSPMPPMPTSKVSLTSIKSPAPTIGSTNSSFSNTLTSSLSSSSISPSPSPVLQNSSHYLHSLNSSTNANMKRKSSVTSKIFSSVFASIRSSSPNPTTSPVPQTYIPYSSPDTSSNTRNLSISIPFTKSSSNTTSDAENVSPRPKSVASFSNSDISFGIHPLPGLSNKQYANNSSRLSSYGDPQSDSSGSLDHGSKISRRRSTFKLNPFSKKEHDPTLNHSSATSVFSNSQQIWSPRSAIISSPRNLVNTDFTNANTEHSMDLDSTISLSHNVKNSVPPPASLSSTSYVEVYNRVPSPAPSTYSQFPIPASSLSTEPISPAMSPSIAYTSHTQSNSSPAEPASDPSSSYASVFFPNVKSKKHISHHDPHSSASDPFSIPSAYKNDVDSSSSPPLPSSLPNFVVSPASSSKVYRPVLSTQIPPNINRSANNSSSSTTTNGMKTVASVAAKANRNKIPVALNRFSVGASSQNTASPPHQSSSGSGLDLPDFDSLIQSDTTIKVTLTPSKLGRVLTKVHKPSSTSNVSTSPYRGTRRNSYHRIVHNRRSSAVSTSSTGSNDPNYSGNDNTGDYDLIQHASAHISLARSKSLGPTTSQNASSVNTRPDFLLPVGSKMMC